MILNLESLNERVDSLFWGNIGFWVEHLCIRIIRRDYLVTIMIDKRFFDVFANGSAKQNYVTT